MRTKFLLSAFLILTTILLAGCASEDSQSAVLKSKKRSGSLTKLSMSQTVNFQTTDSVTIAADWVLPSGAKKAVLLLHMMPEMRASWTSLSAKLNKAGFATLAIDLRGHGESVKQGQKTLDYKKFSDAEHQASRLDVDAAMNFLKSKGFAEKNISVVGASIGANLALDAMRRYKGVMRGVLLSPGLDYHGVKTELPMKDLLPNQKVWIVAAEGDSYSAESSAALQQIQKEITALTIFGGADHGTNLFASQSTLIPDMIKFLMNEYSLPL